MNVDNFKYLKEGVTTDLVELLIKDYRLDMQSALTTLYESDTYAKLSDPSTGLYFQSSLYIYSYLQEELRTGKIA